MQITTIGLDIAKNVFQVHCIDAAEKVVVRKQQLLARRPFKVVAIALANKMARVAWALLARGGTYRVPALAAA